MGNRAKRVGDLSRTITCSFCGQQHRKRSRELRECRRRRGRAAADPPAKQKSEARPGTPTTRYENDPLRGDKNAQRDRGSRATGHGRAEDRQRAGVAARDRPRRSRQDDRKEHGMRRYLSAAPTRDYPEGVRLVHNFYPGPPDDPGRDRSAGLNGFRYWITDEPNPKERRCFCGWLDGREHYGTVHVIEAAD